MMNLINMDRVLGIILATEEEEEEEEEDRFLVSLSVLPNNKTQYNTRYNSMLM
jgi:hypothetical protein